MILIPPSLIPIQVKGFRSYVDMYLKDKLDETGNALKVVHEQVNPRWEVCLTMSEKGFQQISFVNSIATSKVVFESFINFLKYNIKWFKHLSKVWLILRRFKMVFFRQGGRHVDYVADQIVSKLVDVVKKKNKGGVAVKAHQVRTAFPALPPPNSRRLGLGVAC